MMATIVATIHPTMQSLDRGWVAAQQHLGLGGK